MAAAGPRPNWCFSSRKVQTFSWCRLHPKVFPRWWSILHDKLTGERKIKHTNCEEPQVLTSMDLFEYLWNLYPPQSMLLNSQQIQSTISQHRNHIWELHKRRFSWSFNFFPASAALHRIKRARSKTAIDLASARCRDRSSGSLVLRYASLWHCISKNPHFIQLYPSHFQIQQIHRQVSRPHSSGALVALWGLPFSPKAGRCTCRSWNLRRTSMPNKAQKGKPFPCYFLLCWFQILTNNKKTTGHQPIQDCETHRLSYDVQTVCC